MFLVTFGFLVFMAVTIAAYYLVPGKIQWVVLLLASAVFYFYAGTPYTVIYLLVTIVTIWAGSNYIDKVRDSDPGKAKRALIATLLVNIGILAALKYMNFFISNFKSICGLFGRGQGIQPVHWAASLGVSFYTLQAVSYLVDVYWGTSKPQKNLLKVALFTSYFPQMSSGPICRYHEMEQLYEPHKFDYQRLCFGMQRMLFGFIKKLVVAENLGVYVNYIFDENANYNGTFLWLGLFAYVVQLYADFSGCMDIVLGASECFGIYMPENFNRPFHSRSIQEFWKRWHITLGTFAQDYIMYPILRSKAWTKMRKSLKVKYGKAMSKNVPTYLAMMILWVYIGIWHGGAWNYVGEGIWFGIVVMLGQLLDRRLKRVMELLGISPEARWWHCFQSARTAVIYGIGVYFFRASSVRQALHYVKASISPRCLTFSNFLMQWQVFSASFPVKEFYKAMICVGIGVIFMIVLFIFQAKEKSFYQWLADRNLVIRWCILYLMLFTIILFGVYGPEYDAAQFIYGGF
ncbi:MAG: MBOAT family O-acyltransferase [Lachnospiraceae bacterium]|nr:MBOAT family O-acyltransferase [Lachnospiraceae bacterium]